MQKCRAHWVSGMFDVRCPRKLRANNGRRIRTPTIRFQWRPRSTSKFSLERARFGARIVRRLEQRQRTATSPDDALIETYLKHKNVIGYYEREARAVWALYKQLTNGKPLKDASRDDGRKLVDYYEKQNLKSA